MQPRRLLYAFLPHFLCFISTALSPHPYSHLHTSLWPKSLLPDTDIALHRCKHGRGSVSQRTTENLQSGSWWGWGGIVLTNWTPWSANDAQGQTVYNFSACDYTGVRQVAQLARTRNESMHTAFVPPLNYSIETTDGKVLTFVRDFETGGWSLGLLPKVGAVASSYVDTWVLPDVAFHEELVRQSIEYTTTTITGETRLTTTSGQSVCGHPFNGLVVVPPDASCIWDFVALPLQQHGLLPGFQRVKSDRGIGAQLKVVHTHDTFAKGSSLFVLGSDLRAQRVSWGNPRSYQQVNASNTDSFSGAQLVGPLFTDNFAPPAAIRSRGLDQPIVAIKMSTGAPNSTHAAWRQTSVADCTNGETINANAAPDSSPHLPHSPHCFVHWTDSQAVQGLTNFTFVVGQMSLSFRLLPDPSNQVPATHQGDQIVIDGSQTGAIRILYDTTSSKVSAWLGLPRATVTEADCTTQGTASNHYTVYRETDVVTQSATATYYPASLSGAYSNELPLPCDSIDYKGLTICNTTSATCDTTPDTPGAVVGSPTQFYGKVMDAVIWHRVVRAQEIAFWKLWGNTASPINALAIDWEHKLAFNDEEQMSESAHVLDCRPEIRVSATRLEWSNRYGGIRCMAHSAYRERTELDFIPVIQCHDNWCTDPAYPYRCTDDACVDTPDGCEQRSLSTGVGDITHMPCPALVKTVEREDLTWEQKAAKLYLDVAQLIRDCIQNHTRIVLGAPGSLSYDNALLQATTELDLDGDVNRLRTYTVPASPSYTASVNIENGGTNTHDGFALASTHISELNGDTTLDSNTMCHLLLPASSPDNLLCHDGTTRKFVSGCPGGYSGVKKCPLQRPHMCAHAVPTQLPPHQTTEWVETKHASQQGYTVASTAAYPGDLEFVAEPHSVGVLWDGELKTGGLVVTVSSSNTAAWTALVTAAHPDFLDLGTQTAFATSAPSTLHFYKTRVSVGSVYSHVWVRMSRDQDGVFRYTTGTNTGEAPLTILFCDADSQRPSGWGAFFYNLTTLENNVAAFASCEHAAWRLPLELGIVTSSSDAFPVSPFPVYLDKTCVETPMQCATHGGVQKCDGASTRQWISTELSSTNAHCLQPPRTPQQLASNATGVYRVALGSQDASTVAYVLEAPNGSVWWSMCHAAPWCFAGTISSSRQIVDASGQLVANVSIDTIDLVSSNPGSTIPLHRAHWPETRACDFVDFNATLTCTPACSNAGDKFRLQTPHSYCLGLVADLPPLGAHPQVQWKPCNSSDPTQELEFNRLSFAAPDGMAQIAFSMLNNSCLFMGKRSWSGNAHASFLGIDYGCTRWQSVRFLREGVVIDSDDPRLYTRAVIDTLYDTRQQTRKALEDECKELVNSDDLGLAAKISRVAGVPDNIQAERQFSDGNSFFAAQQAGTAPFIGCSLWYHWVNGQPRITIKYAFSANHTTNWVLPQNQAKPVEWTVLVGYGTENVDSGAHPWATTLTFSVRAPGNTSGVTTANGFGLPVSQGSATSHFEPIVCIGAGCVPNDTLSVPIFKETASIYGETHVAFGAHRVPPSTNTSVVPVPSAIIKGRNWDIVTGLSRNTTRLSPSTPWTKAPWLGLATPSNVIGKPTQIRNHGECQRMCELSAKCESIAWNATAHRCSLLRKASTRQVVRPSLVFATRTVNPGSLISKLPAAAVREGAFDPFTGKPTIFANTLAVRPTHVNRHGHDSDNRSVAFVCLFNSSFAPRIQFDVIANTVQEPHRLALSPGEPCGASSTFAGTQGSVILNCPNVTLGKTYSVLAVPSVVTTAQRFLGFVAYQNCTQGVPTTSAHRAVTDVVLHATAPALVIGIGNRVSKRVELI